IVDDHGIVGDHDNAMNVIRHDHECIQVDGREPVGQCMPCLRHHASSIIDLHVSVHNLAEQARPILCAEGDVVRTGSAVIVSPQTNAAPTVSFSG
ncbi:hypothetical protein KAV67_00580, partial [Candidatus Bipolaricaulota bacterium]|nr:hypothetical protein [Candidatus Bipolaricaulota bacterium]